MSSFGDFDPDDAYDREPPAPEQVAYKLHALRLEVDALAGAAALPAWDDLTAAERDLGLAIGVAVVDWLVTHTPDPTQAAISLHNVRRYIATSRLPAWDELNVDDRQIGIDLMSIIIAWLLRQGALG